MEMEIPLEKMTTTEKLKILETIWDDLQRSHAIVPPPSWHADVLQARQKRIDSGASQFSDWSEVKRRIRGRVE